MTQVLIPPAAAVYQRQLSVSSLHGQTISTSESWEVNGHTTRCTCRFGRCPDESYRKTEISTALWTLGLGEYFTLYSLTLYL